MTVIIPVSFEDFQKMRDRNHPKYQLFYVEEDGRFKLFMFQYANVIYYSKVDVRNYINNMNLANFDVTIDLFKRTYLNDGIKVNKVLISAVSEYDGNIPTIEEIEGEEYNTNEAFNTEQQEHEIPDETDGKFPLLDDLGIKV